MAVLNGLLAEEIKAKLKEHEREQKEEILQQIVDMSQEEAASPRKVPNDTTCEAIHEAREILKNKKKKVDKITILDHYPDEDEKIPSKFFIQNALGNYVFFHYRSRTDAQKECDSVYGKGKYTIKPVVKAIVR